MQKRFKMILFYITKYYINIIRKRFLPALGSFILLVLQMKLLFSLYLFKMEHTTYVLFRVY